MKRRRLLAVVAGSVFGGCASSGNDHETTAAVSLTGRLHVQSRTTREYELGFELRELANESVVYNRILVVEPRNTFSLGSEFSSGMDYYFQVKHNGETIFDLTIYPYESYVLAVRDGPEIEITTIVED